MKRIRLALDELACLFPKEQTSRSQPQAASCALEQLHVEIVLKALDQLRRRRRRDAQFTGGGRHAERFADHEILAQNAQVEVIRTTAEDPFTDKCSVGHRCLRERGRKKAPAVTFPPTNAGARAVPMFGATK